jgi:hypothetical protein
MGLFSFGLIMISLVMVAGAGKMSQGLETAESVRRRGSIMSLAGPGRTQGLHRQ